MNLILPSHTTIHINGVVLLLKQQLQAEKVQQNEQKKEQEQKSKPEKTATDSGTGSTILASISKRCAAVSVHDCKR